MKSFLSIPISLFFLILLCHPLRAQEEASPIPPFMRDSLSRLRQAEGETPILQEELCRAAEAYARDLRDRGGISHRDEAGQRVRERLLKRGLAPLRAGEVLGYSPRWEDLWRQWRLSPGHRRILVDPQWTHWGGAWIKGPHDLWIGVLIFTEEAAGEDSP